MRTLDKFKLDGKCGIVTGGGNGIGKGIARGLCEAGAKVLIAGRGVEKLKATAAELNEAGLGKVYYHPVDMAQPKSISALAENALEQLGRIDFLFNNAGTIHREPTENFPAEVWERTPGRKPYGPLLPVPKGSPAYDRTRRGRRHS